MLEKTLNDLFLAHLKDIYYAEKKIYRTLPKMVKAAQESELKKALTTHREETQGQIERLEQVFEMIGKRPQAKTCEAMKGLVAEGDEVISAQGDPSVKDAALIAAAQRVEHYEIAGYGTARTFAQQLGKSDAARLLQETLDEEADTDKKLTELAVTTINIDANEAERLV